MPPSRLLHPASMRWRRAAFGVFNERAAPHSAARWRGESFPAQWRRRRGIRPLHTPVQSSLTPKSMRWKSRGSTNMSSGNSRSPRHLQPSQHRRFDGTRHPQHRVGAGHAGRAKLSAAAPRGYRVPTASGEKRDRRVLGSCRIRSCERCGCAAAHSAHGATTGCRPTCPRSSAHRHLRA